MECPLLELRTASVIINDSISSPILLENGTPQGSVISPILFLVMINDFPELSKHTSTALFADDSTIWRSGKNMAHIITHLQEDLALIEKWCLRWGFTLNHSKTTAIVFTKKKKLTNPVLFVNNTIIKVEQKCYFLGVYFDKQLTWNSHIQYICERAESRLNLMRCISGQSWEANKKILLMIYRSLIRSLMDYACMAFNFASQSTLKIPDSIQYKALLIATGGMKGTSLAALLAECGEKKLEYRRKELIYKYLIKIDNLHSNPAKSILEDRIYPTLETKFKSKYQEMLEEAYDICQTKKEVSDDLDILLETTSNLAINT
ncbi:MAG: reverse transcriptase domain-containing protein, partial [Nitrososphaerales archaeon]